MVTEQGACKRKGGEKIEIISDICKTFAKEPCFKFCDQQPA